MIANNKVQSLDLNLVTNPIIFIDDGSCARLLADARTRILQEFDADQLPLLPNQTTSNLWFVQAARQSLEQHQQYQQH